MSLLLYLKNFINDKNVASVAPTSSFGVERVCRRINFEQAGVIVEFGPGSGAFTRELLKRMRPDARLVAFEVNESFVRHLTAGTRDRRLSVLHCGAEESLQVLRAMGIERVDTIVSGVPFSFFEPERKIRIIDSAARLLQPYGQLLTYQAFPPQPLQHKRLRQYLKPYFTVTGVEYEFRNIPPLQILDAIARPAISELQAAGAWV